MNSALRMFEGIGIELEYMIVDRVSTAVYPGADVLLSAVAGEGASEYLSGEIGWSNELARHVIELKNPSPHPDIAAGADLYHRQVLEINRHLDGFGCRLMPTGMHPFMDPFRESALWPVDEENIYRAYDHIFDCRGHGWTNLQSIHCNISFSDDNEFSRLHTAVRMVLPLLPALCASTPFVGGAHTGLFDNRLEFYRNNQRRVSLVTGQVIPEVVFSREQYEERILQPMYRQIAPYDPEGALQYEWLNSRGAIARFDRMAIEIRLMDIQECPASDCAVCALVIETVKALADERLCSFNTQCRFSTDELEEILLAVIRHGGKTVVESKEYLTALGMSVQAVPGLSIWKSLADALLPPGHFAWPALEMVFNGGTLAERMYRFAGVAPDRKKLIEMNLELCDCLSENRPFE